MAGALPSSPRRGTFVALAVPLVLLALLVGGLFLLDPSARLSTSAPPAEDIAFERVELRPGVMILHVRNAAAADAVIAQVLVDDAYWSFAIEPTTPLGRFESATITLDYPWVEGEAHRITILSPAGTRFEHEIPVAIETPQPTAKALGDYALIGILVGVVPVAVGMAFFPSLRRVADRHYDAVLALTLGVLAFLLVDTVVEGIELAGEIPAAFHGTGLFFAFGIVAVLLVLGIEKAVGATGRYGIALLIAIAIGIHNMGEGLLIGSAFALGSLTLGSALIAGFALHNVTEGPAIVSPLQRLPVVRFLVLLALAGVPTVAGAWLGAFTATGILSVVFFGLGAGAIVVVLVQVGRAMGRDAPLFTPLNGAAFGLGFLVMLATAMLVA